ncbi:MAG: penicillin-binding protein 2 [Acidobacteriota bacterium]
MNQIGSTYQRRVYKRTIILAFFFFLWFFGLTLRLIELQVIEHPRLREAVLKQNQRKQAIVPERGTIFDRHRTILARSLPVPSVFFIPNDEESTAAQWGRIKRLKKMLGLSDQDLQKIRARIENKETFIFVKRKISQEQADEIARLNLNGVHFLRENKRFYPLRTLAAHVLGGVLMDGDGAAGVELQYDSHLAGVDGERLILLDANKRRYEEDVLRAPKPGQDLILTLDGSIQYIAERELDRAVREHQASWGTAVVSHPASGEILAMATSPTYDPNTYPPSPDEVGRNRALQENFEPGSTFKIVTASAARETGTVAWSEVFDCSEGRLKVAGWTISDHKKMGVLNFAEVIIHSSNVGTAKVGQRLGAERLYRMIRSFRFGEKTGIDLPGEEKGIFHPLEEWSGTSLCAHSIGYEISVTAVQVLQAMNIIANRGTLVPFRITRETFNPPGFAADVPASSERIISEKTASDLTRRVFEHVVLDGTGQPAQVDGFHVAGKTGTAQKLDPNLHVYLSSQHLASFVGFVPAENPLLSIVVVLDEPKSGLHYGGQVAAPVFREIARRVLLYLRQSPEFDPAEKAVTAQMPSED